MRRQLIWQVVPSYCLVTVGALALQCLAAPWLDRAGQVALAAALAVVAALVIYRITRAWARTLEVLRHAAEQYAAGHFSRRLPRPPSAELGGLVDAVNTMAAQLHERLRSLRQQRNELEAVLASMGEGMLAVDSDERILRVNAAFAALLGIDAQTAAGRSIYEVVRHASLQALVRRCLAGSGSHEGDLVLRRDSQELSVLARATPLLDGSGQRLGVLVVLEDVTRLRRLERVRQEFVSNVTHELRTPVTAIQAAAETLLDGAVDDPANARRFLTILQRQADRLEQLISDLLELAQLEADEARGRRELAACDLLAVLRGARSAVEFMAAEKGLEVAVTGEPVQAPAEARLLEAAVVNLIENAIKYSERQSRIEVRLTAGNGTARIEVQDWGPGIAPEHHARLFERFYRVDKARSRELGGTGLGLAIVKHIAQAHGGRVGVESAPGEGSTFWIELPAGQLTMAA